MIKRKHLVRWIRLSLIAVIAVWQSNFAMLIYASMAWTPLGLMYAALGTAQCAYCNTGTQGTTNIQVDLAGVANSLCSDCANFNTTHILTYESLSASLCDYVAAFSGITICGGSASGSADLIFEWISTDFLRFRAGPADTFALWASPLGAGPVDCQSATGLSGLTPHTTGTGLRCDTTAATATITPLP